MKRFAACLLLLLSAAAITPAALAEDAGLEDLDKAIQAKTTAQTLEDMENVVKLCESALTKGLDKENEEFARRLLSSTLYENASRLCDAIFAEDEPDQRWPLLRQVALPMLNKAVDFDPTLLDGFVLIAKLQALPGGAKAEGIKAADAAIKLAKDNNAKAAEALVLRASLEDDSEKQMADLNQALKLDPASKDALRARGLIHLANNDSEKAAEDFKKLLSEDTENATAHHAIAEALVQMDKIDEALEHINKAIELQPDQALGYTLRARVHILKEDVPAAMADLDKAVEVAPDDAAPLLLRARLHQSEGDLEKARKDIDKALAIRPGLIQGILLRSLIFAEEEKYDDAARDMQKLVDNDPQNVAYRLQLAAYLSASGRPRAAIDLYAQMVLENEENWLARRGRADALLSIGKQKEAIEDYEAILKLQPEHSGVLNNLAWVLATSPDETIRDADRSIELGKKAVELTESKEAHILSTLAAGYAEKGDFDKAREFSGKAVEAAKEDEEMSKQLRQELENYQQSKPWRELQQTEEKPALEEPPGGSFEL